MLFTACVEKNKQSEREVQDTLKIASAVTEGQYKDTSATVEQPEVITYHYLPLDSVLITTLKDTFSEDQLNIILAVNRVDFEHIWKVDTLVVPDTFVTDINRYSPFPDSLNTIRSLNKLILFSYPAQAFAVYENGKLIRWGPTSMGKRSTPTPTGLFHANWKAKQTTSTENPEWKLSWYVNLDNNRGVSLHQYDLPGFPASHACMRLYENDAHWFYDYVDQWILIDNHSIAAYGTPVIIFGKYPFRKRKPWLSLPEKNDATHYTMDELEKEIENYLPLIEERKMERDSLQSVIAVKDSLAG